MIKVITDMSQSLYPLHAASIALVPPTTGRGSGDGGGGGGGGETSPSTVYPPPLPLASSSQSRAFLLELLRQSDGGASLDTQRTLLWIAENGLPAPSLAPHSSSAQDRGEARSIEDSLQSLPQHWRLHNAVCCRCVGLVIPGITASSLLRLCGKGKEKKMCSDLTSAHKAEASRDLADTFSGPPLVCLQCQLATLAINSQGRNDAGCKKKKRPSPYVDNISLKSYLPLTSDEKQRKKNCQRCFPSVRRRQLEDSRHQRERDSIRGKQQAIGGGTSSPSDRIEQRQAEDSLPSRAVVVVESSKRKVPTRAENEDNHVAKCCKIDSSGKDNDRRGGDRSYLPRPEILEESHRRSKSSNPRAQTEASVSSPSLIPSSVGQQRQSTKKGHKAALRSMLAKGGRQSEHDGVRTANSQGHNGSGAGGDSPRGLRDFLAGL